MKTTYLSEYSYCPVCEEHGRYPSSYKFVNIRQLGNSLNFHRYTFDLEMAVRELTDPAFKKEQDGFLLDLINAETLFRDSLLGYPQHTLDSCERIDGDIIPAWIQTVHLELKCITCHTVTHRIDEFLVYPFSWLRVNYDLVHYDTLISKAKV